MYVSALHGYFIEACHRWPFYARSTLTRATHLRLIILKIRDNTSRQKKKIIYIYIYEVCILIFFAVQCSIRRSRARYILRSGKNKETILVFSSIQACFVITYSSGDFVFVDESTYQPFTKPNTTLDNVHRESNYPPTTTKNILVCINRRLSSFSSDKASFDQAAPPYQKALDECGYRYTLHYEPPITNKRKNRRQHTLVQPPFFWPRSLVQTNQEDCIFRCNNTI